MNPHENSCSKVISILITGNSLHESSSVHSNTNQYNINGLLCTYTEMFRIQTCCNHILSAAEGFRGGGGGGGGRRQHARILYKGSRGGPLFSGGGGGVQLFSRGSKC